MNVLITISENFLFPAKVMLYSLAKYNKDLAVYIIYNTFSPEKLEQLQEFVQEVCHAEFKPVLADNIFADAPLSEQYGKPELYYRLLAPYVLPEGIDRILYLDADIIVRDDLSIFYTQDLEGACAAFIKDRYDFCDEVVQQKKVLGMSDSDVYFNSGVILFDLKKFREKISLPDIMNVIAEKREVLRYFDQDTLNFLLRKNKKICDEKYNFQVYPFEELTMEDILDKSVVHFTDQPKPWSENYSAHLGELFWEYATLAGLDKENKITIKIDAIKEEN